MWFSEIPINGLRISPAAFVATVMFFWTMSKELISIESAVWFETGSSKISANSVNCGRIFCVKVCSRAFVWFRTEDTRLSTFLPAVKTSSSPLCKSSFPYNPTIKDGKFEYFCFQKKEEERKNQSLKLNQIWFDGEKRKNLAKLNEDDCEHDSWSCGEIYDVCVCKKGRRNSDNARERKWKVCLTWKKLDFMELLNSPSPIAAQQSTVTIDRVTFKLVIEWAGRGLRSQHLDIK